MLELLTDFDWRNAFSFWFRSLKHSTLLIAGGALSSLEVLQILRENLAGVHIPKIPVPHSPESITITLLSTVLISLAKGSYDVYRNECIHKRKHSVELVYKDGDRFGGSALLFHALRESAYRIRLAPILDYEFRECVELSAGQEKQVEFVNDTVIELIWAMRRTVKKNQIASAEFKIQYEDVNGKSGETHGVLEALYGDKLVIRGARP